MVVYHCCVCKNGHSHTAFCGGGTTNEDNIKSMQVFWKDSSLKLGGKICQKNYNAWKRGHHLLTESDQLDKEDGRITSKDTSIGHTILGAKMYFSTLKVLTKLLKIVLLIHQKTYLIQVKSGRIP